MKYRFKVGEKVKHRMRPDLGIGIIKEIDGYNCLVSFRKFECSGTIEFIDPILTDGYSSSGYDKFGFDRNGYDFRGYDREGYDREGFDKRGYNKSGFNRKGYNKDGYNRNGFDRYGFNRFGRDKNGFYRNGFNEEGIHKLTQSKFGPNGFDIEGFDQDGFNKAGYDREGFDKKGFNKDGIDRDGYNNDGFNMEGFDREGYDRNGYNKSGVDRNGFISIDQWKKIILDITKIPDFFQYEWLAYQAYSELTLDDKRLALYWAKKEKEDKFTKSKMISARVAEKVCIKFYEQFGFKVEDVSIKQENTSDKRSKHDWTLYDIVVNDNEFIDVKNSRNPINSETNYFEHSVPKFKRSRSGKNVSICGMLSTYIKYEDMENPFEIDGTHTIKYLGETNITRINSLEKWFNKNGLRLNILGPNFIPRWVFNFPESIYKMRKATIEKLNNCKVKNIPSLEICNHDDFNPIIAFFLSKYEMPSIWKNELQEWQIAFYERLRFVDMPILFLSLLTHFLEMIREKTLWDKYHPNGYFNLLYTCESCDDNPLGVFDPLKVIKSFIQTLCILWDRRNDTNLNEFVHFKFNGYGLLEGKRIDGDKYETILAYCGGFIHGMGKCGYAPLVLGKEQNCPECGKLICEMCGFCSSERFCRLCAERMNEMNNSSHQEDNVGSIIHDDSTDIISEKYDFEDFPF